MTENKFTKSELEVFDAVSSRKRLQSRKRRHDKAIVSLKEKGLIHKPEHDSVLRVSANPDHLYWTFDGHGDVVPFNQGSTGDILPVVLDATGCVLVTNFSMPFSRNLSEIFLTSDHANSFKS
jgi:hypothetical protein